MCEFGLEGLWGGRGRQGRQVPFLQIRWWGSTMCAERWSHPCSWVKDRDTQDVQHLELPFPAGGAMKGAVL